MMINLEGQLTEWYKYNEKNKRRRRQPRRRTQSRRRRKQQEYGQEEHERRQEVQSEQPSCHYYQLETLIGKTFLSKIKCHGIGRYNKQRNNVTKTIEFGQRFTPTVYNPYPTDFELLQTSSDALKYIIEGISTYQQQRLFNLKLNYCSFNEHMIGIMDVLHQRQLISQLQIVGSSTKNIDLKQIGKWIQVNSTLHTIDIRCYYWTEQQFRNDVGLSKEFIQALAETTSVRDLRLHIPCLGQRALSGIIHGIATNLSLKKVSLMVQWKSLIQFETFMTSLLHHPSITELRFENSIPQVFTFSWVPTMSRFLSSKECKITSLGLSGLCLQPDDLDLILSSLWEGHPMRHLDVGSDNNKPIDIAFPRYLAMEKVTNKLERINFSNNSPYLHTSNILPHQSRYHRHDENRERDITTMSESLCAILEKCPKLYTNLQHCHSMEKEKSTTILALNDQINYLLDRNLLNRFINIDSNNNNSDHDSDGGDRDHHHHHHQETLPYESIPINLWSEFISRKIVSTIPSSIKRQADQIFRLLVHEGIFIHLLLFMRNTTTTKYNYSSSSKYDYGNNSNNSKNYCRKNKKKAENKKQKKKSKQ